MKRLLKLKRIGKEERRLFFTGMAAMALVRLALFFWSVQRIAHWLSVVFPERPVTPRIELHRAARLLAQAASFCPLPVTCLAEALASRALMARLGYSGNLCIGVLKSGGRLDAHAWVEYPGNIVLGNPTPHGKRYVRLPDLERLIG
jgi:hypothetical protein